MTPPLQLMPWALGLVFSAGSLIAGMRLGQAQARKDINAIGKIQRHDRWNLMLAMMVVTEKREDRQRFADLMREQ